MVHFSSSKCSNLICSRHHFAVKLLFFLIEKIIFCFKFDVYLGKYIVRLHFNLELEPLFTSAYSQDIVEWEAVRKSAVWYCLEHILKGHGTGRSKKVVTAEGCPSAGMLLAAGMIIFFSPSLGSITQILSSTSAYPFILQNFKKPCPLPKRINSEPHSYQR